MTETLGWGWTTLGATAMLLVLDRVVFAFMGSQKLLVNTLVILPLFFEDFAWISQIHWITIVYCIFLRRKAILVIEYHWACFWWITTFLSYPWQPHLSEWHFRFQILTALTLLVRRKPVYLVGVVVCWALIRVLWFSYWCYYYAFTTTFMKIFFGSVCVAQVALLKSLFG